MAAARSRALPGHRARTCTAPGPAQPRRPRSPAARLPGKPSRPPSRPQQGPRHVIPPNPSASLCSARPATGHTAPGRPRGPGGHGPGCHARRGTREGTETGTGTSTTPGAIDGRHWRKGTACGAAPPGGRSGAPWRAGVVPERSERSGWGGGVSMSQRSGASLGLGLFHSERSGTSLGLGGFHVRVEEPAWPHISHLSGHRRPLAAPRPRSHTVGASFLPPPPQALLQKSGQLIFRKSNKKRIKSVFNSLMQGSNSKRPFSSFHRNPFLKFS